MLSCSGIPHVLTIRAECVVCECVVCECGGEASIMRRPWPIGGYCEVGKSYNAFMLLRVHLRL